MKTKVISISLFTLIVLSALVAVVSCEQEAELQTTTLDLVIRGGEDGASRTIMPGAALLDVSRYSVSGQGPAGESFGPVLSTENSISVSDIASGTWVISARALNVQGNELAYGSATLEIERGQNTGTVILDSIGGTGNLELNFTWEDDICISPTMSILVTVSDSSGAVMASRTTEVSTSACAATVNMSLAAGSHLLSVLVSDHGGDLGIGATDALRIVSNTTSSGEVHLRATGLTIIHEGQLQISNVIGVPIGVYIDYFPKSVEMGQSVTLSAICSQLPEGMRQSDLSFRWYEDGVLKYNGGSGSYTFTAEAGVHRYDVIVRTMKEGTMSGASLLLNVAY